MEKPLIHKSYLHGVERNNGVVFSNLGMSNGILWSPEYVYNVQNKIPIGYMTTVPIGDKISHIIKAYNSPSEQNIRSVRDISIDELRNNNSSIKTFISRRSTWYVWAGAILRNGGKVGIGVPPYDTKWISDKEKKRIIRVSDLELKFEEIRRKINPELASRLSSLYLAENNDDGRRVIGTALKNYEIFKVKIADCEAFAKVDMRWIQMYSDNAKIAIIEDYWLGKSAPAQEEHACWEYLLEGSIELVDKSELEEIKAYGVKQLSKDSPRRQ